jgi:hypothetical protein
MYKSILSLCFGLIPLMICLTPIQAQGVKNSLLFQKYMKLGESHKIQVLMNAEKQEFSEKELISRLKNSSALTTAERTVYQDMLKDVSSRKATEFINAIKNYSSVESLESNSGYLKKSQGTQFLLNEHEFFIDFGGFGWHTLDKYSYDNNQNNILWVQQNYDSTAGWVNSSLMMFYYDSFNRDTLEVNQAWDTESSSWLNYGKWPTTYDANNNPVNTFAYYWADPEWVLSGRRLYTFDANNNILEVLTQIGGGADWVNDSRETYTYDVNNNQLTDIYVTWNGTAWQEFTKYENTYDANNNLSSFTFSIFGNYSNKDIYTYDSNNNQLSDSSYNWIGSSWDINFVQTNTYDSNNNLISYLVKTNNGSKLLNYLSYDATFNASNEIISWRSYIFNAGNWDPDSKGEYSYDTDHNMTLYTETYTLDGGLTWILFIREAWTWSAAVTVVEEKGNNIPANYSLTQNYPNPFNPSTKISWQSPVSGHQTLKVYDVLGNEVVTLVDEYKEAGKFEATFDASQLSSGVYFYKLQAGNFVETKKMILLK